MVSKECRYTDKHEWARKDGDVIVMGISDYAQTELGDIVYVEIPQQGDSVSKGTQVASIESVKAVSEIYAPVSGTIEEVNGELEGSPEMVNTSPFGDGWICKIKPEDLSQFDDLMSPEEYEKFLEKEA